MSLIVLILALGITSTKNCGYNREMKLIPETARVSANTKLHPHLAFRKTCLYFPRVEDAEYIAILFDGDTFPQSKEQFETEVLKYRTSTNWPVLLNDPPLLIFKKK